MQIPTVKVCSLDNSDEFIIINQTDYNPETHQLYPLKKSKPKVEPPKTDV
jgi:hypothetical protein